MSPEVIRAFLAVIISHRDVAAGRLKWIGNGWVLSNELLTPTYYLDQAHDFIKQAADNKYNNDQDSLDRAQMLLVLNGYSVQPPGS